MANERLEENTKEAHITGEGGGAESGSKGFFITAARMVIAMKCDCIRIVADVFIRDQMNYYGRCGFVLIYVCRICKARARCRNCHTSATLLERRNYGGTGEYSIEIG